MAAAACASRRRIEDDAFARQVVGEGAAFGGAPREAAHLRRLRDRQFRRQFVFRRARLQFFEGERQLVDQSRRTLRALAVDLTLKLGDPQLLRRDQRHVLRSLGARDRQLRLQGGVLLDERGGCCIHETQ